MAPRKGSKQTQRVKKAYCTTSKKEAEPIDLPGLSGCPHCAEQPTTAEPRGKGKNTQYRVVCVCGMAGPLAKTAQLAGSHWNRLPRGRPPVYEEIRNRALGMINGDLGVYMKKKNHKPEDCIAIAKMLEAATMCVDTWEL